MRRFPGRDRFDKSPGRENAVTHSTDALTLNFGTHGAGNSEPEVPLIRFVQIRKVNHTVPHLIGRRINHNRRCDLELRTRCGHTFHTRPARQKDQHGQCSVYGPHSRLGNHFSNETTECSQRQCNRGSHRNADGTFKCKGEQCSTGQYHRKYSQTDAGRPGPRRSRIRYHSRNSPHHDRSPQKQGRAIRVQCVNADSQHRNGDGKSSSNTESSAPQTLYSLGLCRAWRRCRLLLSVGPDSQSQHDQQVQTRNKNEQSQPRG